MPQPQCISAGLVSSQIFCNSPMGSNARGPNTSAGPESTRDTGSNSLEGTTMVPHSSEPANSTSTSGSTGLGGDDWQGPCSNTLSVGFMAHLREKYSGENLSRKLPHFTPVIEVKNRKVLQLTHSQMA